MHVGTYKVSSCLRWIAPIPRGWTLMAYERNGKMVCRYFYPEPQA